MGKNPQRGRVIPGLSFWTAFFDPHFDPFRMVEKGQDEHYERCLEYKKTPATVEIAGVQVSKWRDSNPRPFGPEPNLPQNRNPLKSKAFRIVCVILTLVLTLEELFCGIFEVFCGVLLAFF